MRACELVFAASVDQRGNFQLVGIRNLAIALAGLDAPCTHGTCQLSAREGRLRPRAVLHCFRKQWSAGRQEKGKD